MRTKRGVITSTKMEKTLVVKVYTYKKHKKYEKRFKVSKKFFVHTESNEGYIEGNKITIVEGRPMSKLKRWFVLEELQKDLQTNI